VGEFESFVRGFHEPARDGPLKLRRRCGFNGL